MEEPSSTLPVTEAPDNAALCATWAKFGIVNGTKPLYGASEDSTSERSSPCGPVRLQSRTVESQYGRSPSLPHFSQACGWTNGSRDHSLKNAFRLQGTCLLTQDLRG